MKTILKFKDYIFFVLVLCLCKNVKAQSSDTILDSLDIVFIESFKDSVDINSVKNIFDIAYTDLYNGNNDRGNRIMNFVLSHIKEPNYEILHAIAVQNLKNGNYEIAFDRLTKAANLNDEVYGYFGWVMLYYFRDYERALTYLDIYDSLTPNFSDAPVGENIDYLRGLAHLQLGEFQKAIHCFDRYISETTFEVGEDWVEAFTFYYKGIGLFKLGEFDKAKENFNLAIKYDDTYTESYYYLYLSMKSLQEPEEDCIKIINKAKDLASKGLFQTNAYINYFYPVSMDMIDRKL